MTERFSDLADPAVSDVASGDDLVLRKALAASGDALRIFRIDDDYALDLRYQNCAGANAPQISSADICEAFAAGDGTVLRSGQHNSVLELHAQRFAIGDETFVVTTERDVTQRDLLERAYDDAAATANARADRYFRLGATFARPAATPDERVRRLLDFVLREFEVGTAALIVACEPSVRIWRAFGDPAKRVEIPDAFLQSASDGPQTRRDVAWPSAPHQARFSSVSVARAHGKYAALCLGKLGGPELATTDESLELLRLCAMLGAICWERYLPVT